MKQIKYTYDIVLNTYKGEYVVFKTNEEHFITFGIYRSPSRKECLEHIKRLKRKRREKK